MDHHADEDLIARFRDRGDRKALLELVSRYQGPIYTFLLGRLGSPQRAEEAAQETFLRMLRGLPGYRAELPFRPWLYRIALNAGRTLVEQGRVRARKEQEASAASNGRRTAVDPAENALHEEVHAALRELPDDQKEALTLHYSQGLSHAEVADALRVPAGTAATRIHQGLQSLRSRFRAIEALALEQVLRSPKVLAAPKSILTIVAAEAARAVPAVAGAAAVITVGGAVNTKTGILITTAILCLAAGGIVGYQVRGTRLAAEAPADAASARAAAKGPERASDERRSSAAIPATNVARTSPAASPAKAAAASTGAAAPSRIRKLAANFAEEERAWASCKDRRNPTKEEQAKIEAVSAKLFMDPELRDSLTSRSWSVDEKTEFTLAYLEEMGFPAANADQAESIRKALADYARVEDSPLDRYSSKVEKRILELREHAALFQAVTSILTPQQQPFARTLEQSGFVGLSEARPAGVVLAPPGPGQAASYVLNAWSKQIVELDEAERAQLTTAASAHAERLWNAQAELQAKFGDPYIRFFSDTLRATARTQDVDALLEQVRNGTKLPADTIQDYKATHPAWESELREGYLRLLQAEKENREALTALLPAKAGSIQKAKPYVYLFSTAP
jgi:RNA polymerase sigma-70 factor (ECF subfamily)